MVFHCWSERLHCVIIEDDLVLRDNFLNNGLLEDFILNDENIFLENFVPLVVFFLKEENNLEKSRLSNTTILKEFIGSRIWLPFKVLNSILIMKQGIKHVFFWELGLWWAIWVTSIVKGFANPFNSEGWPHMTYHRKIF